MAPALAHQPQPLLERATSVSNPWSNMESDRQPLTSVSNPSHPPLLLQGTHLHPLPPSLPPPLIPACNLSDVTCTPTDSNSNYSAANILFSDINDSYPAFLLLLFTFNHPTKLDYRFPTARVTNYITCIIFKAVFCQVSNKADQDLPRLSTWITA